MTPFGLRKKLRGALGLGGVRSEVIQHKVTYVLPDGSEQVVDAEEGYNLLMASQALPSPIATGRRAGGTCPDGGCALCRVEVIDGTGLSTQTDHERASLAASVEGLPHEGRAREPAEPTNERTRLACYTKILGPGGRVQVLELMDFDSIHGDPDGF